MGDTGGCDDPGLLSTSSTGVILGAGETPDGENKLLPLERLDSEETIRLNRERNVEFVLRSENGSQP